MVIQFKFLLFTRNKLIIQPYIGRTWKSSVILFFMAYAFPNLTLHLLLTNCMKYITEEGNVSNLYSRWALHSKIICFISGYDNVTRSCFRETCFCNSLDNWNFIFYTLHIKIYHALYLTCLRIMNYYYVNLDRIIFFNMEIFLVLISNLLISN